MKLPILITAVIILGFLGCGTPPNKNPKLSHSHSEFKKKLAAYESTLSESDYGPAPIDYENRIDAYIRPQLKDPDSARFRVDASSAEKVVMYERIKYRGYIIHGPVWRVKTYVNAKNSYGGYTGEKLYYIYFFDNKIVGYTYRSYGEAYTSDNDVTYVSPSYPNYMEVESR